MRCLFDCCCGRIRWLRLLWRRHLHNTRRTASPWSRGGEGVPKKPHSQSFAALETRSAFCSEVQIRTHNTSSTSKSCCATVEPKHCCKIASIKKYTQHNTQTNWESLITYMKFNKQKQLQNIKKKYKKIEKNEIRIKKTIPIILIQSYNNNKTNKYYKYWG
jgi:hypothetical protein